MEPSLKSVEFPVISLKDADAAVVPEIRRACSRLGFFYISDHDVNEGLTAEAFNQVRTLFALPMRDKMRLIADKNQRGYVLPYEQCLDPPNQISGDTKEAYYIGPEIPPDSPDAALPLHGPNQWPDPSLLPSFKETMNQYMDAMKAVGDRLLRLITLALELPEDFFHKYFENPFCVLRPVRYTEEVSNAAHAIFASGAHREWDVISVLAMNSFYGLQGLIEGQWQDLPHQPGTFCIIVGEILERWTNGLFKALHQRVLNTSGQEKYAIPYFLKPNFGAEISCLPVFLKDKPAQYPTSTCGHLVLDRYDETHFAFKKPPYDARITARTTKLLEQQNCNGEPV